MNNIITHESHYQTKVANGTTGACGIFQANPCSKLLAVCPDMAIECQVKWGIDYIKSRYQKPQNAWQFWQEKHPVMVRGQLIDVGNWY